MADKYELPEEMLQCIFLRMPTKPLLRLKCLSKHWNRVISDENFMKLRSKRMIILPGVPLHAIDYTVPGNDTCHSMIKLHFPFENLRCKRVSIVGTVDGLVLLLIKERYIVCSTDILILYNPFTTEFKIISDPQSKDYNTYSYGYGYGTTRDDLKIVRIGPCANGDGSISYGVLSLKNGSWNYRSSELLGKYFMSNRFGMFVNGFSYWIAHKWHLRLIVAFDFKKMVFSEIVIPPGYTWDHLGTFNGHICLLSYKSNDIGDGGYELKVMNEQGPKKSWSTICSLTLNWLTGHLNGFNIIHILDEGKLLMLLEPNKLIIYDMCKDSYKEVNNLISFDELESLHFFEYVESSISPSHICYNMTSNVLGLRRRRR